LGEFCQQVHGYHAFSRSRTAFHNQDHLFVATGFGGQGERCFIDCFLFVNHDEFPVAPDHGRDAVCQLFGRPQAAVFYAVQDVFVVPILDEFLDEFPQFYSIRF